MQILNKQTSLFGETELTSLQEDSLVSRSVQPGSEKAQKMTAISGQKCYEQFKRFNRATSWAKTFVGLLIGTADWYSTRCYLTWKMKATKSHRFYFQLAVSTPRTEGIESGLLPTPKATEIEEDYNQWKARMVASGNPKNVGKTTANLGTMARSGLLPTPQAIDGNGNGRELRMKVGNRDPNTPGSWKGDLKDYAAMGVLPTPTANAWKGGRTKEGLEKSGRNQTNSLPDFFAQTGKTSQLNPQFVAEMMGYPPNWTELPFLNGETNQ